MTLPSDIVDPTENPQQAALQLEIELIRAGKLSPLQGDASNMLSLYQQFRHHFESDNVSQ